MKTFIFCFITFLVVPFHVFGAQPISVCTDDDNWFPYIYIKNGHSKDVEGIIIDLTRDIFSQLGYEASYQAFPWLRCMKLLKQGEVDVVIAGTYTEERAQYANYPDDASKLAHSAYVLVRDPFVVVTHNSNHFIYKKEDAAIPTPIRSQYGYNITNEFIGLGIEVKEYYAYQAALDDLLRTQKGSVLINRMSADNLLSEPKYEEQLHFNSTPIRIVPYFIMFSKQSKKLTKRQRDSFYQQIRLWRESTGVMYHY